MTGAASSTASSTCRRISATSAYSGLSPVHHRLRPGGQPVEFAHRAGRELLPGARPRPELRRRRARPDPAAGGGPRRGVPVLPRLLDRAPARRQRTRSSCTRLIDSESASGAVRMTFRPGDMTIVDVETIAVPARRLSSMSASAAWARAISSARTTAAASTTPARRSTNRAACRCSTAHGEWLWRPLQNPETLQISAFVDQDPEGLRPHPARARLRRLPGRRAALRAPPEPVDRADRRVGPGRRPADRDPERIRGQRQHPGLLATEGPDDGRCRGRLQPIASSGAGIRPSGRPLATVAATRVGRGSSGRRRRFLVDFTGEALGGAPIAELKAARDRRARERFRALRTWPYPERKTLRVAFELDPGNENACEMRLLLEAAGKPISETWLYRWTP